MCTAYFAVRALEETITELSAPAMITMEREVLK